MAEMTVKLVVEEKNVLNPPRWTFWHRPVDGKIFLLIDYFINSHTPAESYVVMKELLLGALTEEAKVVSLDLFRSLEKDGKLREASLKVSI